MARKQAKGRQSASREERRRRQKHEIKSALHQAWQKTQQGRWQEAADVLEQLDQRQPGQPEVLKRLAEIYPQLGRFNRAQAVAARLIELNQESADVTLLMAGACLNNLRLAMALSYFERFVDRWPADPRCGHARETMSMLEAEIAKSAARAGVPSEEARQLAVEHEAILEAIAAQNFVEAESLARRLHERYPAFAPAGNNLADALFYQGRIDQSLAVAREVLVYNPTNSYALATLTSRLCNLGRFEEAREYAEQLRVSGLKSADSLFKQLEAFSYLGDDQAVLDTWAELAKVEEHTEERLLAVAHHLTAVALMRLGQESDARVHWYDALDIDPELELADENLDDSNRPIGEREGPWPFEPGRWMSQNAMSDLHARLSAKKDLSENEVAEIERGFLAEHPEVEAVIPVLLDRGDPEVRALFLRMAIVTDTPAMREALKAFALGKRGSEGQRIQAAEHLCRVGVLDAQRLRMWVKGEQRDVMLAEFELHEEATSLGDAQAEELARQAYQALSEGDGARAEELLNSAIDLVPDRPSLHNNLANAYKTQGREEEAIAKVKWIRQRYPDYLFGRVQFAHRYIASGELDLAEAELRPLRDRRRLHVSEFSARMLAEVRLAHARRDLDAARTWLDFWERFLPDDPQLDVAHELLEGGLGRLNRLIW
ncbi:MAG TPA: tetratricopeptide repeat protein [Pirellulales bacterium]|nr:tetratricopeptide repeat protein [Pirellulales bacterium]